jgi:4-amino-4-deoxy-L-arabinose transferase-like glycosyltransferase
MTISSPSPPATRARPRWLIPASAVLGMLLLALALGDSVRARLAAAPAGPRDPAPVEVVARLGGVSPQGQSTGFAVANDGTLAVVDRGRQVVIRLDANGERQAEWGPRFGPGLVGQDLVGIAADGDGWWLLDRAALHVLRLDNRGQAQPDRTLDLVPLATYGPNGLATNGRGNLYVADTGRNRILVFNAGGPFTGSIGEGGSDLGKLKQPMFMAFAPDGALFVSDWENERIQRFDADRHATNAWPLPGHAWGVAVDSLGRVFVPDAESRVVRMFGPDGSPLAEFGGAGSAPIPLAAPSQVAVSPDARWLWVLGSDGLARIDLSGYADVRPPPPAQPANTPLAVIGAMLLALAAGAAVRPRWQLPLCVAASEAPAMAAPRAPESARITSIAGAALLALGAVEAIAAEWYVADPSARSDPWPRLGALAAASLIFATGVALSARARPGRWISAWPRSAEYAAPSVSDLGMASAILATGLAVAAATTWWLGHFQTPEATRGALFWLAALLVVVAVLSIRARLPRPSVWTLLPWGVFVLALVPRAWHNADLPYGVWFDEAEAGVQARKFLQAGVFTPITDTYGRDASLFYYLIAAAQALIPDPVLAGRLVSAMVGALCAPVMYLLGRELFGWRVGVLAALLLATSRWHLNVSRLGWDPISLPLCAILAFWLLARAVRTRRWSDAVWAGLAFGLGMHAYVGFRPLPIVGLALLGFGAVLRRWRLSIILGRVAAFGGAAVLAALPVLVFAIQDPAAFNGRLSQTLILNEPVAQAQKLTEVWTNLQKHALMFHISGDLNGRHNLPGAPMLDPVSGLLLMIGLAVVLLRPFDWRSPLLLGWAAVSMAGGVFTFPFEAPQAMRTLGVTPVLALVIALALVVVLDRAASFLDGARLRRPGRVGLAAAGMAVMVWIGAANLTTFFGRQMNDPAVWEAFSTRETIPVREALDGRQAYEAILGSPTITPSIQQDLLVPHPRATMRGFDPATDLPYHGTGPALIVLETEHDAGVAAEVARYYPDAQRRPVVPPSGTRPTVAELLLEPDVIAGHRGLHASPADDGAWRADLSLQAPGVYAFRAQPGYRLSIDQREVSETTHVRLERGNHLLTLSGPPSGASSPRLEWLAPGATDWRPVDDRVLFAAPEGGNGLLVTFSAGPDFQGSPSVTQIDPIVARYYHINPFAHLNLYPTIWSAEWRGSIDVPATGVYRFEAERLSRAGLWIDERGIFDDTVDGPAASQSGVAQLTAGRHTIRVRLQDRDQAGPRLYLYWTPPGGARELVPGRALYPPPPEVVQ